MTKYSQLLLDLQSGVYFSRIHGSPRPHSCRVPPQLVFAEQASGSLAHTIVMPVYNHAFTLHDTLSILEKAATLPHALVAIDDGSDDKSSEAIVEFFKKCRPSKLRSITVLRNETPIFETACDNIGFYMADTPFVIEVQADLRVDEPGFDAKMIRVLEHFGTASSCSGRCGHSFSNPRKLWPWDRWNYTARLNASRVGLYDESIEHPEKSDRLRGFVYECETVNRGPWALRRSDLQKFGFLNEGDFFLGDDDHDYHRRTFQANGARPLYLPMRAWSRLLEGAGRRERSGVNRDIWEELKRTRTGSEGYRRFLIEAKKKVMPVRSIPWNTTTQEDSSG